jgi:membrane fusion protein (multidrug efflux system)
MEMEETKNNRKKKITRIILVALLVAGSAFGFYKYRQSMQYETTDDAQLDADISPVTVRISGYVKKVYFKDNQQVKKGDTLVTFDDRDLAIKVLQAEAALQNAMASREVAGSNAASASYVGETGIFKIEEIKIRIVNAQKELDRYKKMAADGSATQQQLDAVQTNKEALDKQLATAEQQLKELNSRTGGANKQVRAAEVQVKQRQADLDFANLQLSYAVVTAPFDGTVSRKNATPGQLIQAGQPLCSIVSDENSWVVANFKETQVHRMRKGMKSFIEIDAFPDKTLTGTVTSFAPATGSKFSLIPPDNATGNYVKVVQRVPVIISLDHDSTTAGILKPGMSVFVKIKLEE